MMRLKSKLLSLNKSKPLHLKTRIYNPANCEEVRIPIRKDKTAKVVGKLAESIQIPQDRLKGLKFETNITTPGDANGQLITGAILVQSDLKLSLMAPEDLREYAGLTTTTIICRQKITLSAAGIELIRWALEGTFGGIVELSSKQENSDVAKAVPAIKSQEEADEELPRSPTTRFLVMDTVTVTYRNRGEIEVEWEGNMMNDGIADSVLAVLLSVESSPAAVKREKLVHSFSLPHAVADETLTFRH